MKNWAISMSLLFLGSIATSHAAPLDAPDTVYVDGQPCNNLCRAYLAWSHSWSSLFGQAAPEQMPPAQPAPEQATTRPPRLPKSRSAAATKAATLATAKAAKSRAFNAVQPAPDAAAPLIPAAHASEPNQAAPASSEPAETAALEPASGAGVTSDAARPTSSGTPPSTGDAADSHAATGEQEAAAKASAGSKSAEVLVALVMARPEINSVADLTQKSVAIDTSESASNENLRTAMAAAGAKGVQLSANETSAVDRVINGEVPAAVLALVSPEAAKRFPEIEGFQVFRIPLTAAEPQAPLQ